ncbi:MAG: PorP/SprF family type IX secretion system membrane protein [Lewinella sp.]|nr:PorP/SprF family type IX secretion system membrane protein [Lewinella sp.]
MKVLTTLSAVMVLFQACVFGQDPHFSQFYANRVYLNPAYAGFDNGTTVTINYRDQWFGIPDGNIGTFSRSFRTYDATVDMNLPCLYGGNFGLAVMAHRDDAGAAPLRTEGAGLAASFNLMVDQSKHTRYDITIGGRFGMSHRRLGSNYLIYSDYLDPILGLDRTQLSDVGLSSSWYPVLGAGILFRRFSDGSVRYQQGRRKVLGNQQVLGISFSNINRPDVSLREAAAEYHYPMRVTVHAGAAFFNKPHAKTVNYFTFAPQFRLDLQEDLSLLSVGFYVLQNNFYLGAFYQTNPFSKGQTLAANTRTLILSTGVSVRALSKHRSYFLDKIDASDLVIGFSYDVNMSGLDSSKTLGVLELNMRINFNSDKNRECAIPANYRLYDGECPVNF